MLPGGASAWQGVDRLLSCRLLALPPDRPVLPCRCRCRVLVEVQPVACVVDESLTVDSSSDSEEDELATAQRCSRRAAAAAARPSGSSMPGWIGRLHSSGSGGSSRLWSPGRLCKAQVCLTAQQAGSGAAVDWRQAVQGAAQELLAGVLAAELALADVASCKLYCLASLLNDHQQQQQQCLTVADLRQAVAAGLPGVQPTVVPVTAVGGGADAAGAMQLEVVAMRCT